MKRNRGYQILANTVMLLVTALVILPFVLLLMSSLTDENVLLANGYSFIPGKFSLGAYEYIFRSGDKIFRAYGMTILITATGTVANIAMTALFAYPLSLKKLPARRVITFLVFFTMETVRKIRKNGGKNTARNLSICDNLAAGAFFIY